MTRWSRGEARIEEQLRAGELQAVRGGLADGEPWLAKLSEPWRPPRRSSILIRAAPCRNELEYPDHPDEVVEPAEAAEAVAGSRRIIDASAKLIPHLGLF